MLKIVIIENEVYRNIVRLFILVELGFVIVKRFKCKMDIVI